MAVNTRIQVTNGISPVVNGMVKSINSLCSAFDKAEAASAGIVDTKALQTAQNQILKTKNTFDKMSDSIDSSTQSQSRNSSQAGKSGSAISGLAGKVTAAAASFAAFAGVSSIVGSAISRVDTIDTATKSLTVLTGSADSAKLIMSDLTESIQGTPIALNDVALGAKKLVAAGMEAGNVKTVFTSIADAAYGVGDGSASVDQLTDAFANMQSAGVVYGDDINRIVDAGVPAWQILANQSGKSVAEMKDAVSSGTVTSTDAIQALTTGIENGTNGMAGSTAAMSGLAKTAGDTIGGSFSNAKTSIVSSVANIADNLKGPIIETLKSATDKFKEFGAYTKSDEFQNGFNQFVTTLTNIATGAGQVIQFLAPIMPMLPVLVAGVLAFAGAYQVYSGVMAVVTAAQALKTGTTMAETAAQVGLNAALLACPLTWIVVGIMAVIAVAVLLVTHWDQVKAAAIGCWNGIKEAFSPIITELQTGWNNFYTAAMGTISWIQGGWDSFCTTLSTGWNNFTAGASTAMSVTQTVVSNGTGLIGNLLSGNIDGAVQNAKAIWDMLPGGVQTTLTTMVTTVQTKFGEVTTFFTTLPEQFHTWGTEMIGRLTAGITEKIEDVKTAASNVAQGIASFLHFSTPDQGPLATIGSWMGDMVGQLTGGMAAEQAKLAAAAAQMAAVMTANVNSATAQMQATLNAKLAEMTVYSTAETQRMAVNMNAKYDGLAAAMQTKVVALTNNMTAQWEALSATTVMIITQSNTMVLTAMTQLTVGMNTRTTQMRTQTVATVRIMSATTTALNKQMVGQMISAINTLPPAYQSTAVAMMRGMVTGINAERGNVLSATSSLVAELKQTFITGLGIHSPAKFGEYVGLMLDAGVVGGLSNGQILSFTNGIVGEMKDAFMNGKIDLNTLVTYLDDDTLLLIDKLNREGDATTGSAQSSTGMIWPAAGEITSWFGARPASDTNGVGSTNHGGLDIGASYGDSIAAAMSGTVTIAGSYGGYGNAVEIDHGNGYSTLYGHMSQIMASVGQQVTQGQTIGLVGSTGWSTGPHLHFSVFQDGNAVDPYPFLQGAPMTATNTFAGALQQAYNLSKGIGSYGMTGNWLGGEGADVARTAITQALQLLGLSQGYVNGLMWAAYNESGYNPNAINLTDSNAAAGDPSRGLLQTIGSTFSSYMLPGHGNIWDPLDNTLAAIRYMLQEYGSIDAVLNSRMNTWRGYAVGTNNARQGLAWVGENGPEIVDFGGGETVYTSGQSRSMVGDTINASVPVTTAGVPVMNVPKSTQAVNVTVNNTINNSGELDDASTRITNVITTALRQGNDSGAGGYHG